MRNMKELFISTQKNKLGRGQISRRAFMASMIAAGVAIPMAMSLATKAIAATPIKGGKFRVGSPHGSTTDSLDPATYENGMMTALGWMYGNCLTEVSSQNELIPELAQSYESEDATTWVFKLRKGVEFHNGKTMDADDVIASINHHRGKDSKSAAKGILTNIKEIKKDGDDVVFVLDGPNADFPYVMSDYHLIIMPTKDGELDAAAGIGTGGYVLEKFEAGVRSHSKRFANYWKEGAAHFDEIEQIALVDLTARQNALLNGDVDAISRVDPKTVALLAQAPTINIVENTGFLHYTFPMRLDTKPFDNADLRMALKLSVNRQEMLDKVLYGHGAMGNDQPISIANRYHAGDLEQREYDADKAAFHYKKSGHSGPVQLSTSDGAFAGAVDAAQLIKASAEKAGIEIEVVQEPNDGYWSNVWNKKGWCACYWGGRPTEDWMFTSAYVEGSEWNDTAWRNTESSDKFNKLVVEARGELDQGKRATLYAECQRLINEDGGALIPMFANNIAALNKKVGFSEHIASNFEMDGLKATERWWFSES